MSEQAFISKAQVAAMFGVDTRTISRYQDDTADPLPIAVKGARGIPHKYDIAAVHQWGVRRSFADLQQSPDGNVYNYDRERARLTHEQADKVALEVAQLRGDLIPAGIVTATWTETVVNMRARLLALPTRAAHQVQAAADLDEIRNILTAAVYESLNEISVDELSDEQRARIDRAGADVSEGEAPADP